MSPVSSDSPLHVVAGAVIDAGGRVLIARRPPGKHLAGGWEFPGGKLRPGEDRREGLARELREEIGIEIQTPRPLLRLRHTYEYGQVLLDMWVVRYFTGDVRGLDGQALRWCSQGELEATELLPADKPIVAALRLPERLVRDSTADYTIGRARQTMRRDAARYDTMRAGAMRAGAVRADAVRDGRLRGALCGSVAEAVELCADADFLVLRNSLAASELAALCRSVDAPVFAHGTSLAEIWELGATGINDTNL